MQAKKQIILFDIDYTLFNTDLFKQTNYQQSALYDEAQEMLEQLTNTSILGVFSEGELHFQRAKLEKTKIMEYFLDEHIHIVQSKEETLEQIFKRYIDKPIFLVDDKLAILRLAKQMNSQLHTIWVKRGQYALNQQPFNDFTPDDIIDDLRLIPSIVSKSKVRKS